MDYNAVYEPVLAACFKCGEATTYLMRRDRKGRPKPVLCCDCSSVEEVHTRRWKHMIYEKVQLLKVERGCAFCNYRKCSQALFFVSKDDRRPVQIESGSMLNNAKAHSIVCCLNCMEESRSCRT